MSPRRCGWLDAVALRYSVEFGGYDKIILNKLDVLSGLETVKICVAYEHPRLGRIEDFPWDQRILAECKPIYTSHKGWQEAIPKSGSFKDLPEAAREYIKAAEEACCCPVAYVGTGVGPKDFLSP